jgi:hypothetical protein
MWQCPKCDRIFDRKDQPHSCETKPLGEHFKNKKQAKLIFDSLFDRINSDVGECKVISIPCCVHLYGKYDFLAALPKKDRLEIRFALSRVLDSPRLGQSVKVTTHSYKNCIDIHALEELDKELMAWVNEAYHLKDKAH